MKNLLSRLKKFSSIGKRSLYFENNMEENVEKLSILHSQLLIIHNENLKTISGGYSNNIPDNIRTLRITAGLAQYELADQLNVSQATIANYEKGYRIPDIDTIIFFSNFFETNIENIVL
ncbi:helix-turn-helix domain-containing protein [Leuconostoc suionicum]|uniref:helix-turn-helix domain-containing protein n=1 Tax=Leuconostoc suionicum TaxID=1511761 RepID=UPI0032DEB7B4